MTEYPALIHKNLSDSAADFKNIVWPSICTSPLIGGGEIIPVELNTSSSFAIELDLLAGIDAWHVLENKRGMRSVASRVQWGIDYQSFTIGYKPSNPS